MKKVEDNGTGIEGMTLRDVMSYACAWTQKKSYHNKIKEQGIAGIEREKKYPQHEGADA